MVVPVATSASIRRIVSRSANGALIDDDMEKAILSESSSSVNLDQDQKDELAFCNRLACILTKERELPKLCQGFPTVVKAVHKHAEKLEQEYNTGFHRHLGRQDYASSFSVPPISDR